MTQLSVDDIAYMLPTRPFLLQSVIQIQQLYFQHKLFHVLHIRDYKVMDLTKTCDAFTGKKIYDAEVKTDYSVTSKPYFQDGQSNDCQLTPLEYSEKAELKRESTKSWISSEDEEETRETKKDKILNCKGRIPTEVKQSLKEPSLSGRRSADVEQKSPHSSVSDSGLYSDKYAESVPASSVKIIGNEIICANQITENTQTHLLSKSRKVSLTSANTSILDENVAEISTHSFKEELGSDILKVAMKPTSTYSGSYTIQDILNQDCRELTFTNIYSRGNSTAGDVQEVALDLSCHSRYDNCDDPPQIKVEQESVIIDEPVALFDYNISTSFKRVDTNLTSSSAYEHPTFTPQLTASFSHSETSAGKRLLSQESSESSSSFSIIHRPIPIYPQVRFLPPSLNLNSFQCETFTHSPTSIPYSSCASYTNPYLFHQLPNRTSLSWNDQGINTANLPWNSVYYGNTKQPPQSDSNVHDRNLMQPSSVLNSAILSQLYGFPNVSPLHAATSWRDGVQNIVCGDPENSGTKTSVSHNRKGSWTSDSREQNHEENRSSQTLSLQSRSCANNKSIHVQNQTRQNWSNLEIPSEGQTDAPMYCPPHGQYLSGSSLLRSANTNKKHTKHKHNEPVLQELELTYSNNSLLSADQNKSDNFLLLTNCNQTKDTQIKNVSSEDLIGITNASLNTPKSFPFTPCFCCHKQEVDSCTKHEDFADTMEIARTSQNKSSNGIKRKLKRVSTADARKVAKKQTIVNLTEGAPNNNTSSTENIPSTHKFSSQKMEINMLQEIGSAAQSNLCSLFGTRDSRKETCKDMNLYSDACMQKIPQKCSTNLRKNTKEKENLRRLGSERLSYFENRGSLECLNPNTDYHGNISPDKQFAHVRDTFTCSESDECNCPESINNTNTSSDFKKHNHLMLSVQHKCNWNPGYLFPWKVTSQNASSSTESNVIKTPVKSPSKILRRKSCPSKSRDVVRHSSCAPPTHSHENNSAKTENMTVPIKEQHKSTRLYKHTAAFSHEKSRNEDIWKPYFQNEDTSYMNPSRQKSAELNKTASFGAKSLTRGTTDKPQSNGSRTSAETIPRKASTFKCKGCCSSHRSFSALLQHQSLGCESSLPTLTPAHATDCVGSYARYDTTMTGDKCQCTPCPICKGIFSSKFRVYTHLQRGCYKERVLQHASGVIKTGDLDAVENQRPGETCILHCCRFRSEAEKINNNEVDNCTFKTTL